MQAGDATSAVVTLGHQALLFGADAEDSNDPIAGEPVSQLQAMLHQKTTMPSTDDLEQRFRLEQLLPDSAGVPEPGSEFDS